MAKEVESHSRQGGIQFWEDTGSHTCVCATCEYMEEFVYLMGYVAESKQAPYDDLSRQNIHERQKKKCKNTSDMKMIDIFLCLMDCQSQ